MDEMKKYIKAKLAFREGKNDCYKCPYYWSYFDSLVGDGDEGCSIGLVEYGECLGCKYPLFIRRIIAYIYDKRQEKLARKYEAEILKDEEKRAYKLLNLSEDIYQLLEASAEEIENLYGRETALTERIRAMMDELE